MFNWYENQIIRGCCKHKIDLSLHDYMSIIRPYWEECTNHIEGTINPLMQIHAMVLHRHINNIRMHYSKNLVMRAFQWKMVFDINKPNEYKTPSDLYSHHPHDKVEQVVCYHPNYRWEMCDLDYKVLKKNLEKVGWYLGGNNVDVETLVDLLPKLCHNLKRRYIKAVN